MADAVTSQTLADGPRNVVMKFTNVSDGTGEAAVTKVDVSALAGAPSTVKIMKIKCAIAILNESACRHECVLDLTHLYSFYLRHFRQRA